MISNFDKAKKTCRQNKDCGSKQEKRSLQNREQNQKQKNLKQRSQISKHYLPSKRDYDKNC